MTVVSTATRGSAATAALRSYGPAIAIVAVQQIFFPAPAGIVVRGLVVGGLTAMVALGMALVYRANRIINFAQADLGLAPTILAFLLIDQSGLPYLVAAVVGLAAAVALGATTERVVIRRFAHSPRLLVTVATIGLSQVLVAVALLLPRLWDLDVVAGRIAPPFDATRQIGAITFDANDLLGLVVTPIVLVAVNVFLRRSDAGTAIRASADSADRAALLGVPVARLQTLVWSVAGALAFVAVFLRSGILDVPSTTTTSALGFGVLLRALVALLLGRLTDLPGVTSAAVALGVLELGIGWSHDVSLIDPVLGLVVLVAVVWRRREVGRVDLADAAAWKAADEIRPVPAVLARVGGARAARWGVFGLAGAVALALPAVLSGDQEFKAAAVLVYAVLGLSLVLLAGWGGIVSLGQVAFFAIGAAVTGFVVSEWGADLFGGLVIAMVVGAAVAALVGIPALRLRGLYLAVTTFAFALATTSYLLEHDRFGWVPDARIERAPLLGGLEVVLRGRRVLPGARRVRAGRPGPAGCADQPLRPGSRGACATTRRPQSRTPSTRSGSAWWRSACRAPIAALAGGLFVHHERAFDTSSYSALENLVVLTMVVIGGMTSVAGALLGALALLGSRWFLDPEWQFLASGLGVLLILLLAPGGLAGLAYRARDGWLRRVARRRRPAGPRLRRAGPRPGARATGRAGRARPGRGRARRLGGRPPAGAGGRGRVRRRPGPHRRRPGGPRG